MRRLKVPIGGTEGDALFRETQNIAAASFSLSTWTEANFATRFTNVAREFTLSRSGFEIHLNLKFHEAIQHRHAPVDMSHLAKLRGSSRRMDLYCWLSYRLSAMEQRKSGRVGGGITAPRPSQTRASGIPALGSSLDRFASRTTPWPRDLN